MEVLDDIRKIIDWYKSMSKTGGWKSHEVEKLTVAARKLSSLLYYLAEQVGDAYNEAGTAKYNFESQFEKRKHKTIKEKQDRREKVVVSIIENECMVFLSDFHKTEITADALHRKLKLMYDAANVVQDQIRQDISLLKMERQHIYTGGAILEIPPIS